MAYGRERAEGGGRGLCHPAHKLAGRRLGRLPGRRHLRAEPRNGIGERLKLSVNINNLFDRVYWERAGTATRSNYYGLPRSAMLTLRANF
nr:TonB-dependent receptor [Alicycliphilus denitrificans]